MILLFMIAVLWNRTHAQCSVDGPNELCQADYNIEECDWDDGDCCEATCQATGHSAVCGVNTPFDCKNPSYAPTEATLAPTPSPTYHMTPAPTEFYKSLSSIGGTYKDTSANVVCMDHHHGGQFVTVGNWEVSDGTGLTFDIEQAPGNQGVYSDYYKNCLVNHTKSTCEAQEFVANDGLHVMTYCCALDIWVIGWDAYDEDEGAAMIFEYYATSESGTIDGLEEWYGGEDYDWSGDDYKTFGSVRIVEG
eukprot:790414_1